LSLGLANTPKPESRVQSPVLKLSWSRTTAGHNQRVVPCSPFSAHVRSTYHKPQQLRTKLAVESCEFSPFAFAKWKMLKEQKKNNDIKENMLKCEK